MATASFAALFDVHDKSRIIGPPPAALRDARGSSSAPSIYELDRLIWGNKYNGPDVSPSSQPTTGGAQTPVTPNELEMSRLASSTGRHTVDVVQTLSNPSMNKWRFLGCCLMSLVTGLNDSAPGALIPYIEQDYNVGYAIVSLIFVGNALGFISAAPFTHVLQARLGRAKMLVLTSLLVTVSYIMLVCRPPFPIVVISFFLTGLGMAWALALNNVFCANLANSTTTLGIFHGSYGLGGTIGPLIATGLASNGRNWSTFYFIPLALALSNALFAYWAFRNYEKDLQVPIATTPLHPPSERSTQEENPQRATLTEVVRNRTTLLGAFFIFAYQGAEVSISGWVISFLLTYRPTQPSFSRSSIGYVTAGFWAGITLGRFLLSHPCHKIGEKLAVTLLTVGAVGFQVVVWLVPNIIGEAVAVAVVGLLLGPVYPCATVVFSKSLGRRLQLGSLSFISALGSSGGAVAPFMTGLTAQKAGTWVLHPICIGLFAVMVSCWAGLGRVGKRME